jgi:hypothetical protein
MLKSWRDDVLILFDLLKLFKEKPWNIEVSNALKNLVLEFRERGFIDFDASGVALLSSAIIYRRKSEEILKLEEPPKIETKDREDVNANFEKILEDIRNLKLSLPFRITHPTPEPSRILNELLEVINRLGISLEDGKEISPPLVAPPPDEFMNTLSSRIEKMLEFLRTEISEHGKVSFRDTVIKDSLIETVRSFLVLLFILTLENYDLVEHGEEIWITMAN